MSMGLEIQPEAVRTAADGVRRSVRDMAQIGVDRIVGPGPQYGNDDLHGAFDEFCGRWQQGVSALLDNATALADGLDAAVHAYAGTDQDFSTTLDDGR